MRCAYHASVLGLRDGSGDGCPVGDPCWGEPSFAVIDCEMTSLDPSYARLIEVAVVLCDRDGTVERRWSTTVDPGVSFAPSVHGLLLDDVAGSPSPAQAARRLAAMCTDRVVVGHNVAFDLDVLRSAGAFSTYRAALCTFENLPAIGITSNRSLSAVCTRLGLQAKPTHRALADADATAELLRYLLERARCDGYDLLVPLTCAEQP